MISEEDKSLVQSTWGILSADKEATGSAFYRKLFIATPELRALFPEDLTIQKQKLRAMVATAVTSLDDLGAIIAPLKALGAQHAGYGVLESHYGLVAEALLAAFRERGETAFTREAEGAWTAVYVVIANTMLAGAGSVSVKINNDILVR